MITIHPYNPEWPAQYLSASDVLHSILGDMALGIEHVGSTAVPDLGAKDVIDIQVTVRALDPQILEVLNSKGWPARSDYQDVFDGMAPGSPDLAKYYAREPKGSRRVHVHIREVGQFNHRFALLFRDFLRADVNACNQYHELKRQAAIAYPNDIDGYLALKGPVFNLLYHMAASWVKESQWDYSQYTTPAANKSLERTR
jgi:GrpB-like predicted nucleotidyltransferase (UPF0157 family)